MKKLANLKGAKALIREEQKQIVGGGGGNAKFGCPVPQNQIECELIGGYWANNRCLYNINYCFIDP